MFDLLEIAKQILLAQLEATSALRDDLASGES
jgi:hypothetical protein